VASRQRRSYSHWSAANAERARAVAPSSRNGGVEERGRRGTGASPPCDRQEPVRRGRFPASAWQALHSEVGTVTIRGDRGYGRLPRGRIPTEVDRNRRHACVRQCRRCLCTASPTMTIFLQNHTVGAGRCPHLLSPPRGAPARRHPSVTRPRSEPTVRTAGPSPSSARRAMPAYRHRHCADPRPHGVIVASLGRKAKRRCHRERVRFAGAGTWASTTAITTRRRRHVGGLSSTLFVMANIVRLRVTDGMILRWSSWPSRKCRAGGREARSGYCAAGRTSRLGRGTR
jgi:hypothetical protein